MLTLHMPVQVWPSQASHIARLIRTVVPQQQDRVLEDLVLLVLNAQIIILAGKVHMRKLLKVLRRIVRKHHIIGLRLLPVLAHTGDLDSTQPLTRQCAQALFLYNARSLSAQI